MASVDTGNMVLVVDDDPNILAGLRRHLEPRFNIACAQSGGEALQLVANGAPVAVALCDMRMPGMSGLELLKELRKLAPDTVRMMLTGNGDQRTAAEAINQGNVFRFFTKPCPLSALTDGIQAGLRQYRLVTAERELLHGTVTGSVRMLTEVLALVAPAMFARSQRLRAWAVAVGHAMRLPDLWCLETSALLSGVGMVAVPPDLAARHQAGHPLTAAEQAMVDKVPEIGADLVGNVPRLEKVAQVVALQRASFGVRGDALPIEARILHALLVLDALGGGTVTLTALGALSNTGDRLDPDVVRAVRNALGVGAGANAFDRVRLEISLSGLLPDDVLESDLVLTNGRLVLASGETVTNAAFVRLRNLAKMFPFKEPVRVARAQLGERRHRWQ
jgi:response regulator RpfG family c-di-GMP phosphodiesterase